MEFDARIPDQLITVDYLLDPNTEDIALEGSELRNGMIVLIENTLLRKYCGEPLHTLDAISRKHALTSARWCRIEKLTFDGTVVRFVGVYSDGSKCVRSENTMTYAWIFKLDSVPTD